METVNDLKLITQYKGNTFKYPIYTSKQTQQIYNFEKKIKTCDSNGRVIIEVIDERNKFSGFSFFARLEVFLPLETWASWTFTRPGWFILRSMNSPSGLPIGDACDYNNVDYSINDAAKNMDDELEKIIDGQVVYRFQNDLQNEEEDEPDKEIQDNSSDVIISVDSETDFNPPNKEELTDATLKETVENEIFLNRQFRDVLNEWRKKDLFEILLYDITQNAYDKSLHVVKKYYKKFDEKCNDDQISNYFDEWIFNLHKKIPMADLNQKNEFNVWQNLYKHDELHAISLVALCLISVGTSESDVERLNSMHRYIVHDRMTNISSDVLLARLRMRAKAISDDYLKRK